MEPIPTSAAIPRQVIDRNEAAAYISIMCSNLMMSPQSPEIKSLIKDDVTKQELNAALFAIKEAQVSGNGITEEQAKKIVDLGFGNIVFPNNNLQTY